MVKERHDQQKKRDGDEDILSLGIDSHWIMTHWMTTVVFLAPMAWWSVSV